MEVLAPAEGATVTTRGAAVNVQVAARLTGVAEAGGARNSLNGTNPQPMAVTGSLISGEINLPATAGEQTLRVDVLDDSRRVMASASRRVSVVDANSVELALLKIEPAGNQTLVEPNTSVELHFNKAIDPSQLQVVVRETLRGQTYVNSDPLGADFLSAKGYQLETVARDRVIIPGELTPLPGKVLSLAVNALEIGMSNAQLLFPPWPYLRCDPDPVLPL